MDTPSMKWHAYSGITRGSFGMTGSQDHGVYPLMMAVLEPVTRSWLEKYPGDIQTGLLVTSLREADSFILDTFSDGRLISPDSKKKDAKVKNIMQSRMDLRWPHRVKISSNELENWRLASLYDFCIVRIGSTISMPLQGFRNLTMYLKPHGLLLVELVQDSGFRAYPYNHAFARAMNLIGLLETDPRRSEEVLTELITRLGYFISEKVYVAPLFIPHSCNRLGSLLLDIFRQGIVQAGHANLAEIQALLQELDVFEMQENTLISRPGVLQITACRAS